MTQQPNQDIPIEIEEKVRESRLPSDRPVKLQSLIDTQAMRFLESMDFQSFNDLSSVAEGFMAQAPLFQGDASFAQAAMALDLTAQLFPIIDTDKNRLLNRSEFAYLLARTNDQNRQALDWLIQNFDAFTRACFFKDQIGRDELEASRNVFHGLKLAHEKFGLNGPPTEDNLKNLDTEKMKDYLDTNKDSLSPVEAAGLQHLIDHIEKLGGKKKDAHDAKEKQKEKDKSEEEDDPLHKLEHKLDARSLATLRALKLKSFGNMADAFTAFVEDTVAFRGEMPFRKAANAVDTTRELMTDLDMGEDHEFTQEELLIASKLTTKKDKKHVAWFAQHFDAITKALFIPRRTKKKHLLDIRDLFQGLSFARAQLNERADPITASKELQEHVRAQAQHNNLPADLKAGLESLVDFMERHAE